MADVMISFHAIMPMFLMVMLGCLIKKKGLLPWDMLGYLNKINYYYIFPALTFQSAYAGDFSKISSAGVIVFCIIGVLAEFILGTLTAGFIDRDISKQTVLIQCCFRTNMLLIGLPLAKNFFDDVTVVVIVYAIIVPIYNFLCTVVCAKEKKNIRKLLLEIFKNPIVVSTIFGIVLNLSRIRLPLTLEDTIHTLSIMGSNLALIILGGYFNLESVRKRIWLLMKISALRLVILPVVFIIIGAFLGFRGAEMMTVLTVFGCPLPTIMFTLTKETGGDAAFAGEAIIFTTLISFFTLLVLISFLRRMSLL